MLIAIDSEISQVIVIVINCQYAAITTVLVCVCVCTYLCQSYYPIKPLQYALFKSSLGRVKRRNFAQLALEGNNMRQPRISALPMQITV